MSEQSERGPEGTDESAGADAVGETDTATAATGVDTTELSARDEWQRVLGEARDKHLRLAAEFENFRRRATKDRQDAGWRAQGDLIQGMVETLDDIQRFAHVDPASTDAATVVEGVAMVERKIMKALGGHGLELISPIDAPFDPALHEAVGTEPAASAEQDHTVARVYQVGYVFRGQLLRPARVVVRQWQD